MKIYGRRKASWPSAPDALWTTFVYFATTPVVYENQLQGFDLYHVQNSYRTRASSDEVFLGGYRFHGIFNRRTSEHIHLKPYMHKT